MDSKLKLVSRKTPKRNRSNIKEVNKRIDTVVSYEESIPTFSMSQLRMLCTTLRNEISFAEEMSRSVMDIYEYSERCDNTNAGKLYRTGLDNELMSLGDLRYAATTVLDEVYAQMDRSVLNLV